MAQPEETRGKTAKTDAALNRGAQEEDSGSPLTETEIEASRRPPSQPAGGRE
jgi:hypothetical protein